MSSLVAATQSTRALSIKGKIFLAYCISSIIQSKKGKKPIMNYKLNLLGGKIPSVPLGPFLSTYDCDICYNITKSTCPSPPQFQTISTKLFLRIVGSWITVASSAPAPTPS